MTDIDDGKIMNYNGMLPIKGDLDFFHRQYVKKNWNI